MNERPKLTTIKKRDGTRVLFNRKKIEDAIAKSFIHTSLTGKDEAEKISLRLTDEVIGILNSLYDETNPPSVENIQDIVEKVLMKNGHDTIAKSYIIYRKKHEEMRIFSRLFDSIDLIDDYVNLSDWKVRENSNMGFSLQGLNNYVSTKIVKDYWLTKIYNEKIRDYHENGIFHVHDLGVLGAYCVGWDLKDLLIKGFGGVPGKVHSKPAKRFRTALGQIVNFFYTLQGEAAGAQAFSNFDTLLAPFIKYEKLNYEQIKQALQEFLFNVNVPTRVGFQTPFTNITMDLLVPEHMKGEKVIIGGKEQKETYGEFQEEMNLINKAFAELMMEGDAQGRPFTFPIPTYNITKNFNWNDEKLNPIWEMTAKYGIPYFSNFVNSDMNPEDARSMCCRLRLDNRELRKRGGGLFGANPLTGSIGVVTVNLPQLAYLVKKDGKNEEEFLKRLADIMDLAKKSLDIKRKVIERFTDSGLYPYSKFYLEGTKKVFGKYWKNHFSTIGIVGMNEAALNLLGKEITTKEGHEFAVKILEFMRNKISRYQEETGEIFNLEATPAEGTSFRLARIDKKLYPEILVANEDKYKEGASPYYTNSSQLPVGFTDDLFEALDLQDGLQTKYTGGTVLHIFLGEKMPDIESTKKLVKKITDNYHLPYFTLSPTFSICPIHGYIPGEHEYCPKCDEEISRGVNPREHIDQAPESELDENQLRLDI